MKEKIPQIEGFRFIKAKPISKGMSGDKKVYLEDGQNRYLLRISNKEEYERKKAEFETLQTIRRNNTAVPKPLWFGYGENDNVYTLLSWIDGEEAEKLLPKLSHTEQYRYGVEAGKILKGIHDSCPVSGKEDWQTRYFSVIQPRLNAYLSEGVPFEGSDSVLAFLEENKHLLSARPQTLHHGDYHMGNLIIGNDNKLSVIDWHTVDFDNYGDPWYEFNRIGVEVPAFAAGQIDGYFGSSAPEEFWTLLAYYLAGSAITSIVWAKYFAADK